MMNHLRWFALATITLALSACKTTRPQSASSTAGVGGRDNPYCKSLGLPTREFVSAPASAKLGVTAADFQLPTTAGTFEFSAAYTGCDNYLFVQDLPRQTREFKTPIWLHDGPALLRALPKNTHVFFISMAKENEVRQLSLQSVIENMDGALTDMSATDAAYWRSHIHYVTVPIAEVKGWLGEALSNPGWGVGIDRFQKIRYIGNYGDPHRFEASLDDFGPNLAMLANEAIYYNFEAKREATLAAEDAEIVPVFKGDSVAEKKDHIYAEVELPDAAKMASFDGLELDLTAECKGEAEVGECPAWDEALVFYVCDKDKPDNCTTEIGRWISTYHRLGRWVHDVTPFLPLLKDGGKRRFAFKFGQPYEMHLSMRFLKRRDVTKPVATNILFQETFGANFDQNYNKKRQPVKLVIPASAKRVELVTVITGHGMQEPGNCAEFCDTTHRFYVNGSKIERTFPETGDEYNCMKEVVNGTVPNQFGTWWYGRSGWCPGREVQAVRHDVTSLAQLGRENEFRYEGLFHGEPYPAGGAGFLVTAAVVVYE